MRRILVAMLAAMATLFIASPAMAQATRTWVSGVGDDVNPCSRTAPCKTFAGAISKTAAGGEIDCLDQGGFGTLTITKSITLDCTGTLGSILASSTSGITVNDGLMPTPGTIKVVIRGLTINGAGTTLGTYGVRVLSGRDVAVFDTYISNFSNAGIYVATGTQSRVTVDHVKIFNADTGIIAAPTGAATNRVKVSDTTIATSGTAGISLVGTTASGYISNVVIVGTAKALDLQGGSVMNSYKNNVLDATTTDAPTPAVLQ